MSLYDRLTRENGTRVDGGSLAVFALGLVTTAFGSAWAGLITTVFDSYIVEPANQVATFVEELYATPGTVAGDVAGIAWSQTTQWVDGFAFLAFPAAVVVLVVTAYLVVSGWSLNG